jgi:hypothetical protein
MKIKNWSKFQHFKDRKPPWVKLYRDVLDDMEWYELDPLASKVLVMCWLIASEAEGRLPTSKILAFRLRMSEKQTIDCLNKLSHWLEQDDINAISEQYHFDSPERETETETETKKEKEKKATSVACPSNVDQQVWSDWLIVRKGKGAKTLTETAWTRFTNQVEKAGWGLEQAISHCCLKNWVSFEADWVAPKQAFANKFDVAHITTPTPPNQDAALRQMDEDRKKAVKPNADVQAKIAELLKGRA